MDWDWKRIAAAGGSGLAAGTAVDILTDGKLDAEAGALESWELALLILAILAAARLQAWLEINYGTPRRRR